ncbi:MAG: hypothetical protein WA624_21325 [Methylocella sp.]
MKQNIYDDPKFFAGYEALRLSERGLKRSIAVGRVPSGARRPLWGDG